ncbi:MAG: hypothetical protein JWR89_4864 [Tardiphaga sp.]|uniref:hypothetical protein n=1 Tax=Tardiphaga sp. TaxID=1926292 RepID=UPI00262B6173|nr:hypothetical protein [Tardiphaga sp.]MDB5504962.1 hypothetical protein [Tardiphaga sp.]
MIDQTSSPNVVDFAFYQQARRVSGKAMAMSARTCRHCGAGLMDGESDDDCSSLGIETAAPTQRKFYAD